MTTNRSLYRGLNDTEMVHYDWSLNVMTRGVFLAIKYGSQAMMVTSEEKPQFGGTIVVTGSCAGFLGSYSDLPYGETHPVTINRSGRLTQRVQESPKLL